MIDQWGRVGLVGPPFPDPHRLIPGSRDDASTVRREGNARDPRGMASEAGDLLLPLDVPHPYGLIPGAGGDLASIGGEGHARDGVLVPAEDGTRTYRFCTLGIQVPDADQAVSRSGYHVPPIGGRGHAQHSDPLVIQRLDELTAISTIPPDPRGAVAK